MKPLLRLFACLLLILMIGTLESSASAQSRVQRGCISLVRESGKPLVRLTLNGKHAYFLVDSGSDLTFLDVNVAKRYGFEVAINPIEHKVMGLNSAPQQSQVAVPAQLTHDGVPLRTTFYAFDIRRIGASIRERTGYRIAGVIGSDLMRKYRFVIDYGNDAIRYEAKVYGPASACKR